MASVGSSGIEAKEAPLGKLFGESFLFKIPSYQRPLSWTKDHFDDLFQDINDAMINKIDQYFLGSILLQKPERADFHDVVDGQQRITATAILLAVMRDLTNNPNDRDNIRSYLYQVKDDIRGIPASMRITPWNELRDLFERYIYEIEGTKTFLTDFESKKINCKDQDDPKYHIYEAISTFKDKLA